MNKLNVMAIIPARSGSKGVLNKNVRLLGDHPLMAYSIAAGRLCRNINRVLVSTDSQEYAQVALKYGAEVPFLRPSILAGDDSTDAEFFRHAFEWLINNENYLPDLIVHLRPTTPLREISVIEHAIDFMSENGKASSLRSASKTHLTPYKMFRNEDGYMKPFLDLVDVKEFYNLPRQCFEDAYIPNGYVDILRPESLMQTNLLHGSNMKMWETSDVPDIDTEQELSAADLQKNFSDYDDITTYLNSWVLSS
jgi:CMP-N,N'-diacetyllegionaminic acid synthase